MFYITHQARLNWRLDDMINYSMYTLQAPSGAVGKYRSVDIFTLIQLAFRRMRLVRYLQYVSLWLLYKYSMSCKSSPTKKSLNLQHHHTYSKFEVAVRSFTSRSKSSFQQGVITDHDANIAKYQTQT